MLQNYHDVYDELMDRWQISREVVRKSPCRRLSGLVKLESSESNVDLFLDNNAGERGVNIE